LSDLQKPRSLSRKIPWPLVAVFLLLTAGLSALSWLFYAVQNRHARAFMENELATVAGLKAEQIMRWRDEQLAFARALQENRANAEEAKVLADDPGSEPDRTRFLSGMKGLQKSLPFKHVELALPGGRVLATYPEGPALPSTPESTRLGHEAWRDGKPLLGTIELDEKTGSRSIDLMVPLQEGEGAETPVALLRMSFDAATEIDPMLDDWPNRRDSAEAILLQIEGGNFVRLSHPRLFKGATTPPPIAVASFRRPASEKALGEEGLVEGVDYRGRPVIEYLRAVPDTPWLVAVKTDLADLTMGMAGRYLILAAVAVALILVCGALLWVFWQRSLASQEAAERSKWDEANRTMDDLMHQIISVMPNPAFFKDAEGRYRGANPAFEKLLGLSGKEIVGKTLADIAPDKLVEQHENHDRDLLAHPGHQVYEAPLQAADGEHRVIFIKMTYLRPDGTVGGLIGILKDITQRLRAEEELDQLRKFSDSTVQTMTEGLVLTDSDGKFSFVNPAAARMLGYTPDDLVDREVASFVPKDQHAKLRRVDEERTKGVSGRYELAFLHKDGSRRVFLVSGGPRVQGAEFGGTLAVLTDISERKAMEEEIKALSLHDELTTLLNRRGFLTLAEQQLKTASRLKKRIALLYLDVDDLKRINDTGGHKLGDRALTEVAFNLKKSFRESDIVARMGGDEFSVLAMESTHLDADALVSRLEEKLAFFNDRSSAEAGFRLAVSIGVFTREPDQQATIEEMLSRADLLMYERKRARKGGSASKPPGPSK
jgi:diguanylate cyclase (GGDEF)-like protein/PAS domain S-box-containing protein